MRLSPLHTSHVVNRSASVISVAMCVLSSRTVRMTERRGTNERFRKNAVRRFGRSVCYDLDWSRQWASVPSGRTRRRVRSVSGHQHTILRGDERSPAIPVVRCAAAVDLHSVPVPRRGSFRSIAPVFARPPIQSTGQPAAAFFCFSVPFRRSSIGHRTGHPAALRPRDGRSSFRALGGLGS